MAAGFIATYDKVAAERAARPLRAATRPIMVSGRFGMAARSFWEELVFRGYLLQNMIDGLGTLWAVIISCILYGVVHHSNPNAGLLSSAIIASPIRI